MPALLLDPDSGSTLVSRFRELTNERSSDVVPDATVYMYLDIAAERLNRRIGYHITDSVSDVVLVAESQEYSLPTNLVEVTWVEFNGKLLAKGDIEQWRSRHQDWRNEPLGFPQEWAIYSNKLVFLPAPSAAAVAAAGSPVIRYVSSPRPIQTYGPEQLATVQDAAILVYGAVAAFSISYPDSATAVQRAEYHEKLFSEEAEMVKAFYAARRTSR